ncbi:protein RcpB [Pasteurella skyensis]|uniref:Protein RcpB n=1 Tax=Phocoenobacter skyensis TaxID=97481 RepID=A0AAJ6P2N2_9PAST|nr:protein RcpB [Pasteurella skyensis]MDP8170823.1 protein RcpB [Pasteurella skyensis]MDP8174929.1 protein RcpB [Pasteurella skyensis]
MRITKLIMASVVILCSLVANAELVQPVDSNFAPVVSKSDMYVLFDSSEGAVQQLTNNIRRSIGSDLSKKVILVYEKPQRKNAVKIRKVLRKLGLSSKHIRLIKKKNAIYPLYAQVKSVGRKKATCESTKLDQVFFDEHHPCALKNNQRIQLKY